MARYGRKGCCRSHELAFCSLSLLSPLARSLARSRTLSLGSLPQLSPSPTPGMPARLPLAAATRLLTWRACRLVLLYLMLHTHTYMHAYIHAHCMSYMHHTYVHTYLYIHTSGTYKRQCRATRQPRPTELHQAAQAAHGAQCCAARTASAHGCIPVHGKRGQGPY